MNGEPLPFPMPNDRVGRGQIVVASVTYIDDERGDIALVLLLNQKPPYFTVAHYAMTDIVGDDVTTPYERGEIDEIGSFLNIVDAIREYEQSGGDG